jgi:hypothetical protein
MARTKRGGKWGTTLTIPPRASGLPREQEVGRIEIDDAGTTRAYGRDGRAIDFDAPMLPLPVVSNATTARFEALRPRKGGDAGGAASSARPRAAVGESYLVEARLAKETRRTLVARFGAPKSENGRDVFTIEGGDTRSVYHVDPDIGAVVEAHVRKNDGTSVDLEARYDQVRPGLFVRSYMSTVFSAPGLSSAMKSEMTLSNVKVEGQP